MSDTTGFAKMKPNNYPLHPGAEHPPTMCMEIPIEEYESIKRENAELKSMNAQLENDTTYEELQDRWFEAYPVEGDQAIPTDVYSKFYVDRMINHFKIKIISFFKDSKNCRGIDTKSLLGQIADAAFKHWRQVEKTQEDLVDANKRVKDLLNLNYELNCRINLQKEQYTYKIREIKKSLWLSRAVALKRIDVGEYLRKHMNSKFWNDGFHTFQEACYVMQNVINNAENACRAKAEEFE